MATEETSDMRERHVQRHEEATAGGAFAPWIGGEPHETGESFETVDPAVGVPITSVPLCDAGDVERAVEAAREGFEREWSETTQAERSRRLFDLVDRLREHVEELAHLECLDTGKPISDARGEVEGAIGTLEYYASICRAQEGRQVQAQEDLHLYTRHEPYGVVGGIVPWNFPIWAAAWKLGPALAAGNCVVLKPSSDSPLTATRVAELAAEVFPDGVLNVVTGPGSTVGARIADHEEVRKVSFTGGTDAGEAVMRSAAGHLAPVTLELGGKSPFVVFPDADLDRVVDAVADGIFYATGQICDAFSRALVHEDVHEEFRERFVERAESYTLGDPLDDATTMGPLTSREQFETVREYVEIGSEEADLLTGGGRPDDPTLADGWYFEPTVFGGADNDDRIAREEIFGPVQTINTFSTYEEAIDLANDTRFGLAAGIGTERTDLAHNAAADIDAGVVYVNEYGPILPEAPYGGMKDSGIGRDLGREVLDHYRQTKSVYLNLGEPSL